MIVSGLNIAVPIYFVIKLSLVDGYQSLRCLQNHIEVYFLILAFEMRLQILGFSQVQRYDSWITNKPLYHINLGARRKDAECRELLVTSYLIKHFACTPRVIPRFAKFWFVLPVYSPDLACTPRTPRRKPRTGNYVVPQM